MWELADLCVYQETLIITSIKVSGDLQVFSYFFTELYLLLNCKLEI